MSTGYESNYPASGYASETRIRTEFSNIEDALNDSISRTGQGTASNAMKVDLDMDGNDILNVNTIDVQELSVNGNNLNAEIEEAYNTIDEFNDIHLGIKAVEPTTDNDGDPLQSGATYFNSTTDTYYIYNGTEWISTSASYTQTLEEQTLTDGQLSVTFTNPTSAAVFYVYGSGVDRSRLYAGSARDYTIDHNTKTMTLNESYPAGTVIYLTYVASEATLDSTTIPLVSGEGTVDSEMMRRVPVFKSIAELEGYNPSASFTDGDVVYLSAGGRSGKFVWTTGDFTAETVADTLQGIYIKSSAVPVTTGCWIRSFTGGVSPEWFGAAGDGTTDDTSEFTAARAFGPVMCSARSYVVNNLELFAGDYIIGTGSEKTLLLRNADNPVLFAHGPIWDGTDPNYPYNVIGLTNIQISSIGDYSSLLTDFVAVTGLRLKGVEFDAYGCALSRFWQVWDYRMEDVVFLNGGSQANSTPALILRSGYGRRQTKEGMWNNVRFEGYEFQSVGNDSEADEGGKKTELHQFSNIKMESRVATSRHVNFYLTSGFYYKNFYVTTYLNETDCVVNIGGGQQHHGDISIYFSGDSTVFPVSGVRVIDANFCNLDVSIGALQPSSMDAIDWDGVNPSSMSFNVKAPYPTISGRYLGQATFANSTVRQLGTASDAVQYVFDKDGRVDWIMGIPANPVADYEDLYIRADSTNFLTLRSRGSDPSASVREIIAGGRLTAGADWDDENLLWLGSNVLWIDSSGRLRIKTGGSAPSSDTDGSVVGTQS